MSMFERLSERVHYLIAESGMNKPCVKINNFTFDGGKFFIFYSIGSGYLSQRILLKEFEGEFYDSLSSYDKQRLIKAKTLEGVYAFISGAEKIDKEEFSNYLRREFKNEQLF